MPKKLVIYHANCVDGFTSAWVAKNALFPGYGPESTPPETLGLIEFVAAHYKQPPPDVTDKSVYICDFSYPREILLSMQAKADSLVVLDHHKSAQDALQGLDCCVFDMHRSGAALTWDYFYGENSERHWLVNYVQDRDLWTWKLPDSQLISDAIGCRPFNFEAWDKMAVSSPEQLALEGRSIAAYKANQIKLHTLQAYITKLDGVEVPAVNATSLNSELANALSAGYPFAVAWSYLGEGLYHYSLRNNGQCDVAKIAEKFGGGGHAAAAGFTSKEFLVPALRKWPNERLC